MSSMKKLMLGAAVAVGAAAMTAVPAQAAHVGIYVGVGAPAAYVPPCPGTGYAWVDGYWSNGYWNPGYWNYVGVAYGGPVVRYGYAPEVRGYVHNDRDRDAYRDRDRDRDRGRDRDRDHFRR